MKITLNFDSKRCKNIYNTRQTSADIKSIHQKLAIFILSENKNKIAFWYITCDSFDFYKKIKLLLTTVGLLEINFSP